MGIVISLIVTFWMGYLIVKKYKPQPVLFIAGLILMFNRGVARAWDRFCLQNRAPGSVLFDAFEFIKQTFSSRAGGLGLNIMAVAGFARYMDHIGASKALVKLTITPLLALRAPYLVMAGAWILGMCLGLAINSASGLAMLLMVTVFPILISLGVSRLSAYGRDCHHALPGLEPERHGNSACGKHCRNRSRDLLGAISGAHCRRGDSCGRAAALFYPKMDG